MALTATRSSSKPNASAAAIVGVRLITRRAIRASGGDVLAAITLNTGFEILPIRELPRIRRAHHDMLVVVAIAAVRALAVVDTQPEQSVVAAVLRPLALMSLKRS